MPEIWNLNALCRCCHTDGNFKTLNLPYIFKENIENYAEMLQNTFNIKLAVPSISASYMICDVCISSLRDAAQFKEQILACEEKFEEYVKNELALLPPSEIKEEGVTYDVKDEDADCKEITIKIEAEMAPKSENQQQEADFENELSDREYDDICLTRTKLDENTPRDLKCETKENKSNKKDIRKSLKPKLGVKKCNDAAINPLKVKKTRRVKCEVCLKDISLRELREHVKTHAVPFSCRYCELQFNEYLQLRKHVKSHPDARQYTCDTCDKSYKTITQLAAHQNVHTRQNVFQCDICNKEFLYKSILRRHIQVHKGAQRTDKRYKCPHCCKMFNNNSYLTAHIQTVHEMLKPFHCPLCPKTYAAKKTLTVHLRIHTGELPYICETCHEGFRSFSLLKYHQKRHVKKTQRKQQKGCSTEYQCKHCNASFTHRGLYIAHLKTHTVKGLMCDQCGKGFYCSYALKRHILNHSGWRPFACELCTRKYTTKFQLQRHVRKYHDKIVTKYKCEVCGKDVEDMPQHLKIHNDRRFACEYCNRTYSQLNTLNRHVKELHCGSTLYGCDFCGKRFVRKRSLHKHKCKAIKDEQNSKSDCASVTSS